MGALSLQECHIVEKTIWTITSEHVSHNCIFFSISWLYPSLIGFSAKAREQNIITAPTTAFRYIDQLRLYVFTQILSFVISIWTVEWFIFVRTSIAEGEEGWQVVQRKKSKKQTASGKSETWSHIVLRVKK